MFVKDIYFVYLTLLTDTQFWIKTSVQLQLQSGWCVSKQHKMCQSLKAQTSTRIEESELVSLQLARIRGVGDAGATVSSKSLVQGGSVLSESVSQFWRICTMDSLFLLTNISLAPHCKAQWKQHQYSEGWSTRYCAPKVGSLSSFAK